MKLWPSSRGGRAVGAFAVVAAGCTLIGMWWDYQDRAESLPGMPLWGNVILILVAGTGAAIVEFRRKLD
jgi:hypothetical protein